ncbi:SLAIN motif-containing protein 1a isoform X1 [Phyllopteryx taeniolatus]|uniref:SLAIN motif-containing protein 1a isoform X1 n=1 Tax=Phyllopteryx taeniolatus TaxID=161469 RepID=UPI002AD3C80C|nr:SLAIN motif-containing protein 1a isoform X1 [Phyllopteryx taeniolatus]
MWRPGSCRPIRRPLASHASISILRACVRVHASACSKLQQRRWAAPVRIPAEPSGRERATRPVSPCARRRRRRRRPMDAEVLLGPPAAADVKGNDKLADAELEVLKLQELVRKLEKQNEQLRSRANAVHDGAVASGHQRRLLHRKRPHFQTAAWEPFPAECPREPFAYLQPGSEEDEEEEEEEEDGGATVLDLVDILDLSTALAVSEPDRWLYVSARAKPRDGGGGGGGLSPLQWCRQVLDHPAPEVQLARMTLCHRLDQAERWRGASCVRPYGCIDGLSVLSCPVPPYTKPAAITETAARAPPPPPPPSWSGPALPLRPSLGLDRGPTFLSNSSLHNVGRRRACVSPQSSLDSEAGISELEDDSISMGYKLQDMTDVEVMARLQEESLRQDYASTSATVSRRRSSFSLNSLWRGGADPEEDDEDEDEGYDQLPPPQPRLLRAGTVQRGGLPHSHTFSSFRDCRRGSAASTFSLGGLAPYAAGAGLSGETHAAYRNGADIRLRRSMPNLMRAPSMPSVPSMQCLASPVNPPSHGPSSLPTVSSLRGSLSFDSSSGLARLQSSIPSPGQLSQRVQSVGNFSAAARQPLKATAYVSPTVLQGPSAGPHSVPGSAAAPQPLKPAAGSVPQPVKTPGAAQSAVPRSSLPRPASFVGLGGALRSSKITQPTRSLLTPPKSLTSLSTLRDASWKDGCY